MQEDGVGAEEQLGEGGVAMMLPLSDFAVGLDEKGEEQDDGDGDQTQHRDDASEIHADTHRELIQ